jgi:hypothetical protein
VGKVHGQEKGEGEEVDSPLGDKLLVPQQEELLMGV